MALLCNYSAGNLTDASQLPGAWANISGSPTIGVADGPGTTPINTVHCNGTQNFVYLPNILITGSNGLAVGAGFNMTAFTGFCGLWTIGGVGAGSLVVQINPDGSVACFIVNGNNTFVTPSGTFTFGNRHEVEVLVTQFNSSGTVTVFLDGVPLPGLTSIQPTNISNQILTLADGASIHTIGAGGYGPLGGSNPTPIVVDSTYACDTSGPSPCNTVLGPCISIPYIPSAPGNVSGFAVTGFGAGWQALAVIPPAGDASYISSSTPTTEEACATSGPSDITAVYGLSVIANQRQDTAGGGRTSSLGIGNGSSQNYPTFYGTWPLGTVYKMNTTPFGTNPFASRNWHLGDLSTLQTAVKVAT